MTEIDYRSQLDEHLRAIEAAARDFDGGDPAGAARRIAEALTAVFQPAGASPTLLSRAGGTYARLASCVPKPPHSQHLFFPLAHISIQMGAPGAGYVLQATTGPTGLTETPRCTPTLGRTSNFRQVQAPDWWKSEPALVIDHSKIARKDLALWALESEPRPIREGRLLKVLIPMNYGVSLEVAWPDALRAAMRQIAHEVQGSPELLKLAGKPRR